MYQIARRAISEKLKLTKMPLSVLGLIIISLLLFSSLFSQNIPTMRAAFSQSSRAVGNDGNEKVIQINPGAYDQASQRPLNASSITVPVGTTVTWINKDLIEPHDFGHHIISGSPDEGPSNEFYSPVIYSGQNFSVTFNRTGTFEYYDTQYPHIRGEVIVVQNTSNNNFLTYENPVTGIKIQYPSNWEKMEQQTGGLNVTFKSPPENPSDTFQEILGISIMNLPSENISLNQVTDAHINTLNKSLPNLQINESTAATLADNPAHTVVYTNNTRFEVMESWTVKGDRAYLVIYIAEAAKYSGYLPVIQQMLDSFEIIPSSPDSSSPVNRPPIVEDMNITTIGEAPVGFKLKGMDPDGDILNFTIVAKPRLGNISSLDSSSGAGVYAPFTACRPDNCDFISVLGKDAFAFRVTDNRGAVSDPAIVTIISKSE
jgi:plastocyanin